MAATGTAASSAIATAGSTLAQVTGQWQSLIAAWLCAVGAAQQSAVIADMSCVS